MICHAALIFAAPRAACGTRRGAARRIKIRDFRNTGTIEVPGGDLKALDGNRR